MKINRVPVDNISNKVLDKLVELYGSNKKYRLFDERETISFDKKREYFLIANSWGDSTWDIEFTFIWIGKNIWQYKYFNTHCKNKSSWVDPEELLYKLLNP